MQVSIVGVEPLGCSHYHGQIYRCAWRVAVAYSGLRPGSQICLGDDCVTVDSESGTAYITYVDLVPAGQTVGGRLRERLEVRPPDYHRRFNQLLLQGLTTYQILARPELLGVQRRTVTLNLPVQETQSLPRRLSAELLGLEVRGSSVYATLRVCGDKAGYLVMSDYCYRAGGFQWCTRDSGFGVYGALVGEVNLPRPGCATVTVRVGGAKMAGAPSATVWGTITVLSPTGEMVRIPFKATITRKGVSLAARRDSTKTGTQPPSPVAAARRGGSGATVAPRNTRPQQTLGSTAALPQPTQGVSLQHRGTVGRPIRPSRLTPQSLLAIH